MSQPLTKRLEDLVDEEGDKILNSKQVRNLKRAGFPTVRLLTAATKRELTEIEEFGPVTIRKVFQATVEIVKTETFITAAEYQKQRQESLRFITTGSKALDNLLGGRGVETGCITEVSGAYSSGKTQLSHQLSVNAQLPRVAGGVESRVLYFDNEGTFRPKRIIEMAEAAGLNPEEVLNGVILVPCHTSDQQVERLDKAIDPWVTEENVKLLVVDSVIAHFRSEYIGRESLAERQQRLNSYLRRLTSIARLYDVAVFVTNQVVSSPDFFGVRKPVGGNILAHASTTRLWIRRPKTKSPTRIARLSESPYLPAVECVFNITEEGIRDVEEKD